MDERTDDEKRILDFFDIVQPEVSGRESFRAEVRPAFDNLVALGLVEQYTCYRLSETGQAALRALTQ